MSHFMNLVAFIICKQDYEKVNSDTLKSNHVPESEAPLEKPQAKSDDLLKDLPRYWKHYTIIQVIKP